MKKILILALLFLGKSSSILCADLKASKEIIVIDFIISADLKQQIEKIQTDICRQLNPKKEFENFKPNLRGLLIQQFEIDVKDKQKTLDIISEAVAATKLAFEINLKTITLSSEHLVIHFHETIMAELKQLIQRIGVKLFEEEIISIEQCRKIGRFEPCILIGSFDKEYLKKRTSRVIHRERSKSYGMNPNHKSIIKSRILGSKLDSFIYKIVNPKFTIGKMKSLELSIFHYPCKK